MQRWCLFRLTLTLGCPGHQPIRRVTASLGVPLSPALDQVLPVPHLPRQPCFWHGPRSKHVCVLKVLPHLTLKAHTRQDPLPAHSTDVEMKMWRSFRPLSNLTPQVRSGATPQALWHQIPPHSCLHQTPVLPLPLDWSSPETKRFCGPLPPLPCPGMQ